MRRRTFISTFETYFEQLKLKIEMQIEMKGYIFRVIYSCGKLQQ